MSAKTVLLAPVKCADLSPNGISLLCTIAARLGNLDDPDILSRYCQLRQKAVKVSRCDKKKVYGSYSVRSSVIPKARDKQV